MSCLQMVNKVSPSFNTVTSPVLWQHYKKLYNRSTGVLFLCHNELEGEGWEATIIAVLWYYLCECVIEGQCRRMCTVGLCDHLCVPDDSDWETSFCLAWRTSVNNTTPIYVYRTVSHRALTVWTSSRWHQSVKCESELKMNKWDPLKTKVLPQN